MVAYKCFKCKNKLTNEDLKKRFVCPACGSKIFYKPRTKVKKLKAEWLRGGQTFIMKIIKNRARSGAE